MYKRVNRAGDEMTTVEHEGLSDGATKINGTHKFRTPFLSSELEAGFQPTRDHYDQAFMW
jgi:hypothetical protein